MSGDGSSMPVRLLPLPGQGPPAHQEAEGEWSSRCGVGITFSLTERGGVDLSGPVVSHVLPGSSADVDGTVQSGDRLVSIDGEPVRTWSMAKVRRVISNKAGARVSLEFDRDGEKLLATLSRGLLGGGGAALEVSHADASSAQLSLSALSGKDPAPSVSRLGGSNMAQVEQLQARCKELATGKAALQVQVSDLLSKEKMQAAKMATMDKELQRSKALAVNLTKELQVMQEKCITLERENAEFASSLKTTQTAKTQVSERARRNEDALRESEQSLVDAQALVQEASRALENEKRACARLQTEMAHAKEMLNMEKKQREESELRQQRSDDQASAHAVHAEKLEEEIVALKQNLRQRELESLDQSQRADVSSSQAVELQGAVGQLQHDLEAIRQEKSKWLDERLELRRAVTELEYTMRAGGDSRELALKATRNPWADGLNPQDKTGATASATLAQRIYESATQIKNMRQEYAEAVSTNQELDHKFVGLVQTNDFFRHRIEDVEGLISSLVSDLCELSGEAENILQDTDRLQSSTYSQSSRDAVKMANFEQRLAQQDVQLKENTETIRTLSRTRDDAQASLERCEQLRASAEDIVRGLEGKCNTLQKSLEKSEEGNRRSATELDLLRRTIHELEGQYRELQMQTKQSTDNIADELRGAKKEALRLQAEISQVKTLHAASMSNAENKEAARLQAVKEREEAAKRLKEVKAEVANLDLELRGSEKERDAGLTKMEEQMSKIQGLERINKSLSDQANRTSQQLMASEKTTSVLQGELNSLRTSYEKSFAENSKANKQLAELQSDLIEMRRLLSSNEAEIENLQTINESVYSEKANASEEVARLSKQYRDVKQQEAHLVAELAESRLECSSISSRFSEQEQLSARLTEELSQSRQQHAEAALHESESRKQLAQMQQEAHEIQKQLVQTVAELDSLRIRFTDVIRQNTDWEERNKSLSDLQALSSQSEVELAARIQNLEENIRSLEDNREERERVVAQLSQTNTDLTQRIRTLESELDEQLGKLHDAKEQHSSAVEKLYERDAAIISMKHAVQAVEFQKSCLSGDLETTQQKFEHESKSRIEAENLAATRAVQIDSLKDLVAKVGEEGKNYSSSIEQVWQDKNAALEGKLQETTEAKRFAESQAKEIGDQVANLTYSNRVITDELHTAQQDLETLRSEKQVLQESLDQTQQVALETKKELEESLRQTKEGLEGSLRQTKEAFASEQNKHSLVNAELQKVTKQRERLREEFITVSQKYKGLMNEADKLANSLDHHSQRRLAQTIRAGDVLNQGMENVRHEFEDDMLRMALDLKDLMHNQYVQTFESPGSDARHFSPERGRSLYKSVSASVVDPKDEIKAVATLGIAKERIQDLEDRVVEHENELAQSINTLSQVHAKQEESEAALLASRQRQESLEQEIAAMSNSQRRKHSEMIKLRSDYENLKQMLDSRDQELQIQKQAVADTMRELKAEQDKLLSAARRDGTLSEEMLGLRNDYHDAIEAYKVSEMRWTKKVLEAETNLAESVETAKLHLNSYRAIEGAKKEMEATLTEKLNNTTKAHQDSVLKYEQLDRNYKDGLQEIKLLTEQNEEAKLAHKGLIVQLEEHEAELSTAIAKNKKLTKSNEKLEEQAKLDQETIEELRDDVERNEKQILELEETLDKVQESCRHQALRMIELEEEVSSLKKSLAECEINSEKVTTAYQDLTNRFNLCLKREMDAVTKIDVLENSLQEQVTVLEQLQSKLVATDAKNYELQTILTQQTSLLVACSNDLETTQVQVDALGAAMAKQSADLESQRLECSATKAALQDKSLEAQTLQNQVGQHVARIRTLEMENDALQGDLFSGSSRIETLEGRSVSLHEMLLRHEAEKLKLQNELQEITMHQIAEASLVDDYISKHENLIAELGQQVSDLPALRSALIEHEKKLQVYVKMEEDCVVLQRDYEILNSSITIVSHQHQTVKNRLSESELQIRELTSELERILNDLLAVQGQLMKSEMELENARSEGEMHTARMHEDQKRLTQAHTDNKAMQKYVTLLEEQVQSLNGFIVMHEKDKEDLKMDIVQLKSGQESDRAFIDSLRLEVSQLKSEFSDLDAARQEVMVHNHEYENDSSEIFSSLELTASSVEALTNLIDAIFAAALNHGAHARGMANHMEQTLELLQPVIDEVIYRTADISMLRDGHRAWLKAEDKLAHEMTSNERLQEENESLRRDNEVFRSGSHSQERVLAALREQLDGLHTSCMQHAAEKGQLKESIGILEQMQTNYQIEIQHLQERLATTDSDLENEKVRRQNEAERFQKKIVALQSELAHRSREGYQVEQFLCNMETKTNGVASTLIHIFECEEKNNMSLGGTVELVEKLVDTLSPMMGQAHSQRGSLLSEVDGLLQELTLSRDEIRKLQIHITLVEANLRDEREARSKSYVALAEATHRVNELQGAVQEFHKDVMGKQRLIAYLEEQHSSMHGTLTAHQVNLKEKERQLQNMDVSWLQDKSQLMRKETELEYFQRCLHEAREHNDLVTDMVVGLERDVLALCAMVEGAAFRGNEMVSLREDRQTLKETQKLLEQDQSKVAVFSEVLANLQENHRNLEAAQCDTIQELEDVSKEADLLKDTAERQAVEIELLTKKLAFSTERGDFYASEVEAKIKLLDRGLTQVTEMVTLACKQIQDLPELRSTRKIVRELEMLLRTTEQSLMSERSWSQGKGAEVKRMENCIQELENRFADKSLQAEKLDKHVQQLSEMVSTLQHDLLELQTVMKTQSKDTFQVAGRLAEAEVVVDEIFSKMSQAQHFQDDYCDVLQKLCTQDAVAKAAHTHTHTHTCGPQPPQVLKELVAKMESMQNGIKELHDKNNKLSTSLSEAASLNLEYRQASAEDRSKIEKLSSDLASKEKLASVLQGQLETLQNLAMSNATEKGKLQESVSTMPILQARLAQTETELDRFQKLTVSLQAEVANHSREAYQVGICLQGLDETLNALERANSRSLGDTVGLLEHLTHELTHELTPNMATNCSVQSEINRLVGAVKFSCQEIQRLKDSLLSVESKLKQEKVEHSKTTFSLADARGKINELQSTLQEVHTDMLGKQRYIGYLEEQQTSLHTSLLETQHNKAATEQELQAEKSEIEKDVMARDAIIKELQQEAKDRAIKTQENIQALELALAEANSGHAVMIVEMEDHIQRLEAQVQSFPDKLQAGEATVRGLRAELKNSLVAAQAFENELIGKQQLVGLLEKQVDTYQMHLLHQETGKIEVEKEAVQANSLRHDLHIAGLSIRELKVTMGGMQDDLADKEKYIIALEQQVRSAQAAWTRLVQDRDNLDVHLGFLVDAMHNAVESLAAKIHSSIASASANMSHKEALQGNLADLLRQNEQLCADSAAKQKLVGMMEEQLKNTLDHFAQTDSSKRSLEQVFTKAQSDLLAARSENQALRSDKTELLEKARVLESSEGVISEILATVVSVESSVAFALTDSRRVRHELLKNMAENVDLRERLAGLEAEHGISMSQAFSVARDVEHQTFVIEALEGKLKALSESLLQVSSLTVGQSSELDNRRSGMMQLEKSLKEQTSTVFQLEKSLKEQTSIVFQLEKSLKEHTSTVFQLENSLKEQTSTVFQLEKSLKEQTSTVFQLENSLAEHELVNSQMPRLQSENESHQKLLAVVENQMQSLNSNLVMKETVIQKQVLQIAELENQNRAQFIEMSGLKSKLNEYSTQIPLVAEYRADAESSERMLQLASSKIENLERLIVQSDSAVVALRDELQDTKDKLQQARRLLGDWQGKVEGFPSETVSASHIIAHLHEHISGLQQQNQRHVADKDALEARLQVMHDIRSEGQMQLETIKHGLAMDRQEIVSLQDRNVQLERQILDMHQVDASKQRLIALMEKEAETSHQQVEDLQKECDALRTEFEEEQQLCDMLQTQVRTLHSIVTQHEALKTP